MLSKSPKTRSRLIRGRQWDSLLDIEKAIRVATNVGMHDGLVLTIEFISGFELFGHYESWGQGFRVSGRGITVEAEHLDDAIGRWIAQCATA